MNIKMNLLTIVFAYLLGSVLVGCGNSSNKQQTETAIQHENSLLKIFKETFDKKESFFDLIRKDVVKERIINDYSQNFYDKLCQQIQVSSPISYTDDKYEGYGTGGRYGNGNANLSYIPSNDILTINFTIGGKTIQRDGEVYYNTEGWNLGIDEYKNDFDEIVKREPVALYQIDGESSYSQDKFVIALRLYAITLWTDELGELYEIKDIRIKDNESGKIYNVSFDEPYRHEQRVMNDNIGVFMYEKNAAEFINLVSSLNNYTISIKGVYEDYEENIVIKNPENLNNMKDVFMKLLRKQEEIDNQK